MARRLGIESPLSAVPSLAIGAADITPLELARAYATLANGGIRPQIRTFEDVVEPSAGTLERQPIEFERVLDGGTAYLVTSLLEGVVDRGTASALRAQGLVGAIAGKTGTSNAERDAWFVGYTPELVAVVWVGFDEPRSLGLASSAIALPVWGRFLREATGGRVRGVFLRPPEVEAIEIDPVSGALALAGCPTRRIEYFLPGTEPTTTCPGWGEPRRRDDPGGPNLLERIFEAWLERL
jgi:membrane carboxypeptidase/penicillin-binding protein